MSTPRTTSGDLIVGAWTEFRNNAAAYGEFAVWFAFLAAVRWAISAFAGAVIADRWLRYGVELLLSLPVFFLHAVLAVAIIDAIGRHLSHRPGTVRDSLYAGFHHAFPAIWTWIAGSAAFGLGLTMAIGGATTPPIGTLFVIPGAVLILPGIWLSVRWFAASYAVVMDGMRANAALKESARLVSGNWWAVFWRIVFPWIFFYVAAYFAQSIAYLVFGSALGDPGLFFGQVASAQDMPNTYRLVRAIIAETISGGSIPLFATAGILLWSDLKRPA